MLSVKNKEIYESIQEKPEKICKLSSNILREIIRKQVSIYKKKNEILWSDYMDGGGWDNYSDSRW